MNQMDYYASVKGNVNSDDHKNMCLEDYNHEIEDYYAYIHSLEKSYNYMDFNLTSNELNPLTTSAFYHDEFWMLTNDSSKAVDYYRKMTSSGSYAFQTTLYKGVENSDFIDLHFDNIQITEGRTFTDNEISEGMNVCVIYQGYDMYSNQNHKKTLQVGDTIPMTVYVLNDDKEIIDTYRKDYEIIGKWDFKDHVDMIRPVSYISEIPVYIPLNAYADALRNGFSYLLKYDTDYFSHAFDYSYATIPSVFQFEKLEDLERFIQSVKNSDAYKNGTYTFYTNVSEYSEMLATVNATSVNFRMISVLCEISVLIASMILVCLDVITRKKEILVLTSLGQSSAHVSRKLAFESGITSVTSMIIAVVSLVPLGNLISNKLLPFSGISAETQSLIYGGAMQTVSVENYTLISININVIAEMIALVLICMVIDYLVIERFIRKTSVREMIRNDY